MKRFTRILAVTLFLAASSVSLSACSTAKDDGTRNTVNTSEVQMEQSNRDFRDSLRK